MVWNQIQYPAKTEPVGDPADFVEPVFFDGWNQAINQPVRPVEYRHTLPSLFLQGEPDDFEVAFDEFGWEQSIAQPVRSVEYSYLLPAVFYRGDPADFVEPEVFDTFGWEQPTQQPLVLPVEDRYTHPSTFLELEPDTLVEPAFLDHWQQPTNQPVLPVEYRYLLPSLFLQGEPDDFVAPFDTFGWERGTEQPLELPPEYRYLLPYIFNPDYEPLISTSSGVFFEAWIQPISQPTYFVEYRYWLPSHFAQIDPDDFAAVGAPATKMPLRVALSSSGKARVTVTSGSKTRITIS